jgi:hypothetical protein
MIRIPLPQARSLAVLFRVESIIFPLLEDEPEKYVSSVPNDHFLPGDVYSPFAAATNHTLRYSKAMRPPLLNLSGSRFSDGATTVSETHSQRPPETEDQESHLSHLAFRHPSRVSRQYELQRMHPSPWPTYFDRYETMHHPHCYRELQFRRSYAPRGSQPYTYNDSAVGACPQALGNTPWPQLHTPESAASHYSNVSSTCGNRHNEGGGSFSRPSSSGITY